MNRRDIELISAYLDGELKPSELAKMETRLKSDPELESEMRNMRATRTLLRKLPTRKAPRNFTLTRKMVGQNPPLPRTYPIFRLATVMATLLFFFSIGINSFSTQMASQPIDFGIGGGGGGGDSESLAEQAAPAMEEPVAPAPVEETELYAESEPAEESSADSNEQPAEVAPADDMAREIETPSASKVTGEEGVVDVEPIQGTQDAPLLIPSAWVLAFVAIAFMGAALMILMRYVSARRWK
ncbi:MAG TPA: hypothetical protein VLA72_00680 [Anaerolineales bacterium]|nr:hypothetical protein [Anaerolineales bacterium]